MTMTRDERHAPRTIPNLTKIRWDQNLVRSIRSALFVNDLPEPVIPFLNDGWVLRADSMRGLPKTSDDLEQIVGVILPSNHEHLIRPKRDKLDEDTVFKDFTRRVEQYKKKSGDSKRASTVIAVALAELGWPVNLIIKVLNISRPTLNKWIYMHQEQRITEEEIELFSLFENRDKDSNLLFSFMFDFRTMNHRTRRSGLIFEKATMLPTEDTVQVMDALWRIAYRTRGSKSDYASRACAATLDIFIEMLLRRGVTALNLGRLLGVQHMAVLQRSRRSNDLYEQVETALDLDFGVTTLEHLSASVEAKHDKISKYTVTHKRSATDHRPAMLFQVRVSEPTDLNPVPTPNVSILSGKGSKETLDALLTLDDIPAYGSPTTVKQIDGELRAVMPNFATPNKVALFDYFESAEETLYTVHPLVNDTMSAAAFGATSLWYRDTTDPSTWISGEVQTEAMLLQATMTYDRERYGAGYGKTTYHWVPAEVLDLINVVPHTESDAVMQNLKDRDTRKNLTDAERDNVLDSLPSELKKLVLSWLAKAESEEGESILNRCLSKPGDVISEFDLPTTPISRKYRE
ncbi:hypothetical protein PP301_gp002 [Gordonia phage GMA2]|uniref:Uncharacterized protein n=1 Tax=Gordonia phage GMA2 TaxID=1647283 RepID=A0A0K0N6I6_9CAUD|nr:hypothetical protein PP301_gp002 [Gordonia phage GMA2]AKJ72539.1 hypothetical protein GMA2_2 [Gordonia phage GMA2]